MIEYEKKYDLAYKQAIVMYLRQRCAEDAALLEACKKENKSLDGIVRYIKQADGISVICFIRRYGKLDKPFVTVQVDLKNIHVMQCYGDHDNVVHDVDGFVKDWIKNAKAVNKKLQRKVA